jgi:hypothetical protein
MLDSRFFFYLLFKVRTRNVYTIQSHDNELYRQHDPVYIRTVDLSEPRGVQHPVDAVFRATLGSSHNLIASMHLVDKTR